MTETAPEADSFNFYLRFAKPLVLNLPDPEERILAAAWVKKLRDESLADETIRREYLKLLLFVLHRRRLAGVFLQKPEEAKLEDVKGDRVHELAKEILAKESQQQKKRLGAGDYPPYVVECSADLLEYAAAQDIPKFGVQGYYAISSEPVTKWENADKGIFPEGIVLGTPQEPVKKVPSEDKTPICKKKGDGEGEDDRVPSPRKPEPPLGIPPKPKDDLPPVTWATNLLDVTEPPEKDVGTPAAQDDDEDEDDGDLAAFEHMGAANLSGIDDQQFADLDKSGRADRSGLDELAEFERLEAAMEGQGLDDLAGFEQLARLDRSGFSGIEGQGFDELEEYERLEAAMDQSDFSGIDYPDLGWMEEEMAAIKEQERLASTPVRAGQPTTPHSARRLSPGTPPFTTPVRGELTPPHSARRLSPGTPPFTTPVRGELTPPHSARRLTPGTPSTPYRTPTRGQPTPPHSARKISPGTPPPRTPGTPYSTPVRGAATPPHSARKLTPGTPALRSPDLGLDEFDDFADFERIAGLDRSGFSGIEGQGFDDLDEFNQLEAAMDRSDLSGIEGLQFEDLGWMEEENARAREQEQLAMATPVRTGQQTPPHSARRLSPGTPPFTTPTRGAPTPPHSARRVTPGTPPPSTPLRPGQPTPPHSARMLTPGTPPFATPTRGAPTPPHSARRVTPGTPPPSTPVRSGQPTPQHSARRLTPGTPPYETPARAKPMSPHSAMKMTAGTPTSPRTPLQQVVPKAATPEGQEIVDEANKSLQQVANAEPSEYQRYQAHKRKDMPETPAMLSRYKEGRSQVDPNAPYDPAAFGLTGDEQFTAAAGYDFTPKKVGRLRYDTQRTPRKEIEQVFPKVKGEEWSELFFEMQQPELADDVDDIEITEADVPQEDVDTRLRRLMATIGGHAKEEALASAGVAATTPGGTATPERRNLYGTDFPIFEEEMPVFESPALSPSGQVEQTAEEQWASLFDGTPPPMPGRAQGPTPAPKAPTPKQSSPKIEDEYPTVNLNPDIPKPPTPALSPSTPVKDEVPTKEKPSPSKVPKLTAEEIESKAEEQMKSLYTTLIAEEVPAGEPQPGTSTQQTPKRAPPEKPIPQFVTPWKTPEDMKTERSKTPPPPTPPSPFGLQVPFKVDNMLAFEQMPEDMHYNIPETPPTPPRPFTYEEYMDARTPEMAVDLMADSPDGLGHLVEAHEMVPYEAKDYTTLQVGKGRVKIPRHSHRPFREADKIRESDEDILELPELTSLIPPTPPRYVTRWDREEAQAAAQAQAAEEAQAAAPSPGAFPGTPSALERVRQKGFVPSRAAAQPAEEAQVEEQVQAAGAEIRDQAMETFLNTFEDPQQRQLFRKVLDLVQDVEEGGQIYPDNQQLEQEALAQLPSGQGAPDLFAASPPKDFADLPDVDDVVVSPWQRPPQPPPESPLPEIPQFGFQGPIEHFMPKYRPYQLPKMADHAHIPFETPFPRGPFLREPPSPFSPSQVPKFIRSPPVVDLGAEDLPTPMRTAGILPPDTPMQRASEPPRRLQPQMRRYPGSAPGKVALAPAPAFDYGTPRTGRPRPEARGRAARRIDFGQQPSPEVLPGTPSALERVRQKGFVPPRMPGLAELYGADVPGPAEVAAAQLPQTPKQPTPRSPVTYYTPQTERPTEGRRQRIPRRLDFEIPPADLTPTGPVAEIKARLGHIFTEEELDDYYDVHLLDLPNAPAELRHLPPGLADKNVQYLTKWQTPEHLRTTRTPPFKLPSPSAVGLSDVQYPIDMVMLPDIELTPQQATQYSPLATEMPYFVEKGQPKQVDKTTTQVIRTPTSTKRLTTKSTQFPGSQVQLSPQPGPSRVSPQPGSSRLFTQPGYLGFSPDISMSPGILDLDKMDTSFGSPTGAYLPHASPERKDKIMQQIMAAAAKQYSPPPSPGQEARLQQAIRAAEQQFMGPPALHPPMTPRTPATAMPRPTGYMTTPRTPAGQRIQSPGERKIRTPQLMQRMHGMELGDVEEPDLVPITPQASPELQIAAQVEPAQIEAAAISPGAAAREVEARAAAQYTALEGSPSALERILQKRSPKKPYWYRYSHSDAVTYTTPEKVEDKQLVDRNRPLLERVTDLIKDVPDVYDVPGPPPSPHKRLVLEEPYYTPILPMGSRPMLADEEIEFPPTPTTPPPPQSPPRSPLPNVFTAAALEGYDLDQEFLPDDLVFQTPPPGTTPVQSPVRTPSPAGSPLQVMTPRTPRTPLTVAPRPEGWATPRTPVPQTEYERQAEIVKQASPSPWKSPVVGQLIDHQPPSPGVAAQNVEAAAAAQYNALMGSPTPLERIRQKHAMPVMYEGIHLMDQPRPIEEIKGLPLGLMDPRLEFQMSPDPVFELPPRPKRYSPPPRPKRDLFAPSFGLQGAEIFEGEPDLIASPTSAFTTSEMQYQPTPRQAPRQYGTPASAHLGSGRTPPGRTPPRMPDIFDVPIGGADLFETSPALVSSPEYYESPRPAPRQYHTPTSAHLGTGRTPRGRTPQPQRPMATSPRPVTSPEVAAARAEQVPSAGASLREGPPAAGAMSPVAPRPRRAAGEPRVLRPRRLDFGQQPSPETNLREGSTALGAVTPTARSPRGSSAPRRLSSRRLDFDRPPSDVTPEGPMADIRARLGHILTEEEMDPYADTHLLDMPNAPYETRKLPLALMDEKKYGGWTTPEHLKGLVVPKETYQPQVIHAPFIVEKRRPRTALNFPRRMSPPKAAAPPPGWDGADQYTPQQAAQMTPRRTSQPRQLSSKQPKYVEKTVTEEVTVYEADAADVDHIVGRGTPTIEGEYPEIMDTSPIPVHDRSKPSSGFGWMD